MKKNTLWQKKVESYYDKQAQKWIVNTDIEPYRYYYSTYSETLLKNMPEKGNALDIGCGSGTFTLMLCRKKFRKIYAVDLSQKMLDILKKRLNTHDKKKIKTIKSDVCAMPFKDNYFDFIICVGLMECISDQKKLLNEISRVLKPTGKASIRWLNKTGIWGFLEFIMKTLRIQGSPFSYNRYSTPEQAHKLCKNAGLKVKRTKGMILLPLFIFPGPLSRILDKILIKTQLSYKIETLKKNSPFAIKNLYYSFCTEVEKSA